MKYSEKTKGKHIDATAGEFVFKDFDYRGDYDSADCGGIFFNIPNPNMILIAGLVLCSALFGFGGGITASVIMLGYTLYFFSTDNSFIHFTAENLQKVVVSLVDILADMLLVCFLKRVEVQAFAEVDSLTKELHKENALLQQM